MDNEEIDVKKLREVWDKFYKNGHPEPAKITHKDVMFMLEHSDEFDGLHEMLLAAMKPFVQPMFEAQYAPAEGAHNGPSSLVTQGVAADLHEENARLKEKNARLKEENARQKEENAELSQIISTLKEDAKKEEAKRESVAKSANQKLSACELERKNALEKYEQAKKERETVQAQLDAAQAVVRKLPEAHLRFVRGDGEVLRLFFPSGLPEDDALAMLGVVAVLAQESSLKRLFDCLSERCKSGQRAAGEQERALLDAALGWFNTQWAEDKRYSLLQVEPGDAFDFNCHTRIGSQTGERVKKMLLPGLADGFGEVLKKVQVQTQS